MSSKNDGRLHGVSVLFVDDDADTRDIVGAYLRYSGALVETAASGFAALSSLRQSHADVLVIDYTMPGMTGIELLQQIRKLPGEARRPTPALLYTAFADMRDIAIAAGFVGYLRKPLDPRVLVEEIARLAGV